MNRSLIVAVLTVTMIFLMSTAGHAAFAVPHNLQCDNCHGKFLGSTEFRPNNACLTCHSALGEASRLPVEAGAMSNYFGSVSGQPATGSRSTHTWGAYTAPGHPYNKKAMVSEPTTPALNSGYGGLTWLTGETTCFRCHNSKPATNDLPGVNKPFLRSTNVNDALCLDCHRARNTSTHKTGSHPVAFRAYSSVYKSNTTAFRKIPLSANVNNPTAQLGNYMTTPNKGKIVCTTCHATHYADSSSATFGNRSTANGSAQDDPAKGLKGQLQNSKGQLLRTDPIGATATSINVCSSCHKETANISHNAKGQNIQCGHCHGAHVDYTGDNTLKNVYLVRRDFSSISTSYGKFGSNVKVIYNNNTGFKRADGKGICQICHTTLPADIGAHQQAGVTKQDCIVCHKHSNGFSASNCTSCHGQPPMTSFVGGPNGKASALYAIDESFTPHATHADKAYYNYACKNCHYDGTRQDSHNTSTPTFQSVFVETTGSIGEIATGQKNISSDYNPTTRTCSNVYCHSNGKPRGGVAMKSYTTPSWEYGRNKIFNSLTECTSCHGIGATLTTNAHSKHVINNAINCNVCHASTVNSTNAITDRTMHANGVKDVKFATRPANFFGVFSTSWNASAGTCNNSCHSNGLGGPPVNTPVWTNAATGACGKCHAAAPTTSLHFQHFSSPIGPVLGKTQTVCSNCHDYTTGGGVKHANGKVDLKAGNSCAPCHQGATSPIWMTGSTVTCESCHTGTLSVVNTYTAPSVDLNKTVGHGQYSSAALHVKCTSCHNASAPHIRPLVANKRLKTAGNALCITCHVPSVMGNASTARADMLTHGVSYSGAINTFVNYTTANDYRSRDCAGCHDTHGTTNYMNVRTVVAGQTIRPVTLATLSTALRVTSPNGNSIYNGLCQVCHTKVKYFTRNAAPDLSHNSGKNCLTCHLHKSQPLPAEPILFAFQGAGGGCGGCHGYPPAKTMTGIGKMNNYTDAKIETNAGAGGAHTVAGHIPLTAKASQTWTNCSNCHYNTAHNTGGMPVKPAYVNVIVNPTFKFNNNSAISYNASKCSNVSCHFQKTPNWTTGL